MGSDCCPSMSKSPYSEIMFAIHAPKPSVLLFCACLAWILDSFFESSFLDSDALSGNFTVGSCGIRISISFYPLLREEKFPLAIS